MKRTALKRRTALSPGQWQGKRKSRNKYSAVRCDDGKDIFDSKTEMGRWHQLQLLEKAGEISGLILKPPPVVLLPEETLRGKKVRAVKWRLDYWYVEDGRPVWEDSKGRPIARDETVKLNLWLRYGPGLLRITAGKSDNYRVKKTVMSLRED